MKAVTSGLAQSVHTRLVQHARSLGVDANLVLTRFATERLLYRLSCSPHAGRFILKGALLILVWLGETIRPTRDADLLGLGDLSNEGLADIFRGICELKVEPDAITFLRDSVRVAAIRVEDAYGGRRVSLRALLGSARLRVQVDVGFGDAVVPRAQWLDYPSMLDLPRPRLRAYPPETVVAEKVHALIVFGEVTSRYKDLFDLYMLARHFSFNGNRLARSLAATFKRRRTLLPSSPPVALTPEFADRREAQIRWRAFLKKNSLTSAPQDLDIIIRHLANFLEPVIKAASTGLPFVETWATSGTWHRSGDHRGDESA